MKLEAEFVASAFALHGCPKWRRTEIALAGRSNVGKSSLLNALARVDGLARTSRTPGRTRCLNFFAVGRDLALVDLPGYGYAKMSRSEAQAIAALMDQYLVERSNLTALILLVDARRGPQDEELQLAEMIRGRNADLMVAATKCDKLRRSERAPALKRFESLQVHPVLCSASDGEGLDELRRMIFGYSRDSNHSSDGPQRGRV